MFFTYARDESYDQVPSPKTSSTKAAMNKLKMRIAKVMSNGDNQPNDDRSSYEVIEVEDAQNTNGDEDIDVVMGGQNQTGPIELEPNRQTTKVCHQQGETGHSRENRSISSEARVGRSPRQSSRSSSRTSSRSSSRNRAHRSCNASPAHAPMYTRSVSRS